MSTRSLLSVPLVLLLTGALGAERASAQQKLQRCSVPGAGISFFHPADWVARPFKDGKGVALVRGKASLSLVVEEGGGSSRKALGEVVEKVRFRWRELNEVGEERRRIDGRSARVIELEGVDSKGVPARARIAVWVKDRRHHVLFLCAPPEELASCNEAWDAVCGDLRGGVEEKAPEQRGKTFEHPIGFRFWYPAKWRAQTNQEGGVFLFPPDRVVKEGEPMEYYVVAAAEVPPGSIKPGKDEVIDERQAVRMLKEQIPTLVGDPEVRVLGMAGGKGVLVDCQVRIEGVLARVQFYLTIVERRAAVLVALALPKLIEKRQAEIERIFASFAFGRAAAATDIVGRWSLTRTYSSGSHDTPVTWDAAGGGGVEYTTKVSAVDETSTTVEIRADGTYTWRREEYFLAMGGYNAITGGSIILGSDKPTVTVSEGRWRAGNGTLCMMAKDGSSYLAEYRIRQGEKGRELLVKTDGKLEVWK